MSANPISAATQVTLLLCSPLRAGRDKDVQTLSLGEFNELEKQLQRAGGKLERLLESNSAAWLKENHPGTDAAKNRGLARPGFHAQHGAGGLARRGDLAGGPW